MTRNGDEDFEFPLQVRLSGMRGIYPFHSIGQVRRFGRRDAEKWAKLRGARGPSDQLHAKIIERLTSHGHRLEKAALDVSENAPSTVNTRDLWRALAPYENGDAIAAETDFGIAIARAFAIDPDGAMGMLLFKTHILDGADLGAAFTDARRDELKRAGDALATRHPYLLPAH